MALREKNKNKKLVSCFHLHWLPDKFWAKNRLTSTTFLGNQARVDVSKHIEDLLALLTGSFNEAKCATEVGPHLSTYWI